MKKDTAVAALRGVLVGALKGLIEDGDLDTIWDRALAEYLKESECEIVFDSGRVKAFVVAGEGHEAWMRLPVSVYVKHYESEVSPDGQVKIIRKQLKGLDAFAAELASARKELTDRLEAIGKSA